MPFSRITGALMQSATARQIPSVIETSPLSLHDLEKSMARRSLVFNGLLGNQVRRVVGIHHHRHELLKRHQIQMLFWPGLAGRRGQRSLPLNNDAIVNRLSMHERAIIPNSGSVTGMRSGSEHKAAFYVSFLKLVSLRKR